MRVSERLKGFITGGMLPLGARQRALARSLGAAWRAPAAPAPDMPPEYGEGWDDVPSPAGSGWDIPVHQVGPQAHPLGGTWPDVAPDLAAPSEYGAPDPALDEYRDTGRGWGIAAPQFDPLGPPSYGPRFTGCPGARTGGPGARSVSALIGNLSRLTFNALLLGIILAILAIPVSIGLMRVASLNPGPVTKSSPPRPIPTAYAGGSTFTAQEFTITYPDGWSHTTSYRFVTPGGLVREEAFIDPSNDATQLLVDVLPAVPADQLDLALGALVSSADSGHAADFQTTALPHAGTSLDGHASRQVEFTLDLSTGKQVVHAQGVAVVSTKDTSTCVLVYIAPVAGFGSSQSQHFSPAIASFRFRP